MSLAYQFFHPSLDINERDLKTMALRSPENLPQSMASETFFTAPKPYHFYEERIKKRDLFQFPKKSDKTDSLLNSERDSSRESRISDGIQGSTEFIKGLEVVGIVLDGNPQVIIEDGQAKTTWFLHKGDRLRQGFVEDIQEKKVILNHQGQRLEIGL